MAKRIKASKAPKKSRTVTKTVTKTRVVKVKAKRAGRKFRRAASSPVSIKDAAFAVAGAGAGGIGGAFVVSKIPATVPVAASNGIVAALGAVVAAFGMKKRNRVIMGVGLGMGAVGVRGLVASAVPNMAGYDSLPAYVPQLAAPFDGCLAAPIAAPGEVMAAPFDGDNDEMI